jgi:hypothetical protein
MFMLIITSNGEGDPARRHLAAVPDIFDTPAPANEGPMKSRMREIIGGAPQSAETGGSEVTDFGPLLGIRPPGDTDHNVEAASQQLAEFTNQITRFQA